MGTGSNPGEVISQVKNPETMGFITPAPQDYLFTQFRVIVTYLRLLVWPAGQNLLHDYPLYQSFFTPAVFLSFLFLSVLFGAAVWLIYKSRLSAIRLDYSTTHYSRLLGFGVLWFFITLSVESGVIPIPMLIDEYRVYLPSVGFFLALMSGVTLLAARFIRFTIHGSRFTAVAIALFAMVILALSAATYARNMVWKDKVSLWEDVARKSPASSRPHNNLGIAYYESGRYAEAIRSYERAISLNPLHLNSYMNLGVAYAVTGRLDAAIEHFSYVAARDPKNSSAFLNLARAYSDLQRPGESIENFLRAIAANPNSSGAFHGLGTAYARLGRFDEALSAFTRFVQLSPHDPESYRNRGIVYMNMGDVPNALADFQKACSLGSSESCNILRDPRFR
jgi:Flp pilus assembly protein TadD